MNQLAKEDVQKKLEDRKIEQVMSKREREEAAMIRVGGGKKGKGGNRKQNKQEDEEEDVFTSIDISILNLFGFLKVSPPLDKNALEPKIKELTDKLNFYIEDGDKKLKEEAEKLLSGEYVEEEEPEETKGGDDHRRGGFRGGRGRGGRGGNFRAGTAAGGDRRKKRDEDDDVYVSSGDEDQRVAKLAKRPSNKKENLALDDNNYPTL